MLFYEIKLNGIDITNSVSIGAIAREKLAEPMDDGSIHLPLSFIDIEYKMKGLLEIKIEEESLVREYEFLIINDDVNEGSKYGDYKHDLTVMEYSGKYDDYIISSFASTKTLKNENPAPFIYNSYGLNYTAQDTNANKIIIQRLYMPKIDIKRTYYANEPIVINSVGKGIQAILSLTEHGYTYKKIPLYLKAKKSGEATQTSQISENNANFVLTEGEWEFEYAIYNDVDYDEYTIDIPIYEEIAIYTFYVRIIPRKDISIYDLLQQVNDMISKFGGIESKHYYEATRLFEVDEEIADYLKSIEAPQMYFQKLTVRQAVNTVFSYVNAISRFKRNADKKIDKISMDEFNKITGIFDFDEGVSSYSTQRSGSELALKGVSFLERAMPNDLEEPTIETPANDMFKTVRAPDIQMTEDNFELKLERPIYQPKKLETFLKDVDIKYNPTTQNLDEEDYGTFDFILDLTSRWINIEEWKLKEITTNFPVVYRSKIFDNDVGLAKNMTENIYWQENDKSIKMSDLFGVSFKEALIINVINSAFNEYITRNNIYPILDVNGQDVMVTYYNVSLNLPNWSAGLRNKLLFNVEYISLEDIVVDFDRKDLTDNFDYYSEAKINQTDKLIAVGLATRGMSGDIQRSGTRDLVVSQHHGTLEEVLKVGMYNPEHRLTITKLKLNLQNEFIGATYMLSKDFNRAQMFRALMQEYRWSEIPTSRQIHDRHEIYKDYLIVERPDKEALIKEVTKIKNGTSKIIFAILNDKIYVDKTKVTYAFVRTDGSSELYDKSGKNSAIYAPVSSFGIKDGLSFSFGFDSNLIAGDGIKIIEGNYYNNAIRYTDLDGRFTKFWFSLKQNHATVTDEDELMNYPLLLIDTAGFDVEVEGIIDAGSPDLKAGNSDYLIWNKDSRQNAKLSYQISVLPEEHNLYVFGQAFFSNNYLVKNRDEAKATKYLYIYDNVEDYEFLRYGILDDLKIKQGYAEKIELNETNSSIYYENDRLKFRITDSDILEKIDEATHWAIGDNNHDLYVTCNKNLYGFDVVERHIRNDILEIGNYDYIPPLIINLNTQIYVELDISHNLALKESFIKEVELTTEVSPYLILARNIDVELEPEVETSSKLALKNSFSEIMVINSSFEVFTTLAKNVNVRLRAEDNVVAGLALKTSYQEIVVLTTDIEVEEISGKIKPDTPDLPTAYSISPTSITLEAIENGLYKMNNGEWQSGETFTGLEPNTQYLFYQKTAETQTHQESDSSGGASITTIKSSQLAPAYGPTKVSVTHNSITIQSITNGEYRIGTTGSWQQSTTLTKDGNGNDLQPNVSYDVYQRYAETTNYNASPPSPKTAISTLKIPQDPPNKPTLHSIGPNWIQLDSIPTPPSGAEVEYKLLGGFHDWQDSTYFSSGISPNKQYSFVARYKETATYAQSAQSVNANFTTTKYSQSAPPTPTLSGKTQNSISINGYPACEYSINGGSWGSGTTFTGLTAGTSYTICQRYYETNSYYASASSCASFTTDPPPPPQLNAPSLSFVSGEICGEMIINISNSNNVGVNAYYDGNFLIAVPPLGNVNASIYHNVGVGQTLHIAVKFEASGYTTSNNGTLSKQVPTCIAS